MELELDLADVAEEPTVNGGLKGLVQSLADQIFRTVFRSLVAALVVVLSLLAISWNVSRLSILDELAKLEVQEYRLGDQLDDLEFRLQTIDFDRLSSEIEDENTRIFQGFPSLSDWAEGLNVQAKNYGLDFSYSIGKPHLSPVPDVLEVPVTVRLTASGKARGNAFIGATSFMETILRDHWHIDVLATEAAGDSSGLVAMSVEAQVWVRDRYGFVELTSVSRTPPPLINQQQASSG